MAGECVRSHASKEVRHFENKETMIQFLIQKLKSGDGILLKGSRANKLEQLANGLQQFFGVEGGSRV